MPSLSSPRARTRGRGRDSHDRASVRVHSFLFRRRVRSAALLCPLFLTLPNGHAEHNLETVLLPPGLRARARALKRKQWGYRAAGQSCSDRAARFPARSGLAFQV